jgi:hypothetical protein
LPRQTEHERLFASKILSELLEIEKRVSDFEETFPELEKSVDEMHSTLDPNTAIALDHVEAKIDWIVNADSHSETMRKRLMASLGEDAGWSDITGLDLDEEHKTRAMHMILIHDQHSNPNFSFEKLSAERKELLLDDLMKWGKQFGHDASLKMCENILAFSTHIPEKNHKL